MNGEKLKQAIDKRVLVGFDGYIDRIYQVKYQCEAKETERFDSMESFGRYIAARGERSSSLELQFRQEKAGGNMPNYAHCLARLGVQSYCIGAVGYPEVMPVFGDLAKECMVYPVCEPGICTALEMGSNKLMLADNDQIRQLDYKMMTSRLPETVICSLLENSDMTAFLNWSEMAGAASIWQGVVDHILPKVTVKEHASFFVDISDCSQQTRDEIECLLSILRELAKRFKLMISLNENEAEQLLAKLELQAQDLEAGARLLRSCTGCSVLVIHLLNGALADDGEQTMFVANTVIKHPKLLTGGGDNFNAGFCFAILAGVSLAEALQVGNVVSGYYVYHGESPTLNQLLTWMIQDNYGE